MAQKKQPDYPPVATSTRVGIYPLLPTPCPFFTDFSIHYFPLHRATHPDSSPATHRLDTPTTSQSVDRYSISIYFLCQSLLILRPLSKLERVPRYTHHTQRDTKYSAGLCGFGRRVHTPASGLVRVQAVSSTIHLTYVGVRWWSGLSSRCIGGERFL